MSHKIIGEVFDQQALPLVFSSVVVMVHSGTGSRSFNDCNLDFSSSADGSHRRMWSRARGERCRRTNRKIRSAIGVVQPKQHGPGFTVAVALNWHSLQQHACTYVRAHIHTRALGINCPLAVAPTRYTPW